MRVRSIGLALLVSIGTTATAPVSALGATLPSASAVPPPSACAVFLETAIDGNGQPQELVFGSDGRLWATELRSSASRVLGIQPGTGAVTRIALGDPYAAVNPGIEAPHGIATASDGNIWITDDHLGHIARIDVPTGSFGAGFDLSAVDPSLGDGLRDIAVGPDGRLWITAKSDAVIVASQSGTILGTYTLTAGSMPSGIIVGPDGNIWFAERGARRIGRITPDGVLTEFPTVGDPANLASDGTTLWFTEPGASAIGRISTAGVVLGEATTPTPNAQPSSITAAANGTIWFTEFGANRVGRVVVSSFPASGSIDETPLSVASNGPGAIAAVPTDGTVWFGEYVGFVAHFKPSDTGRVLPLPPTMRLTSGSPNVTVGGVTYYSLATPFTIAPTTSGQCVDSVTYTLRPVVGPAVGPTNVSAASAGPFTLPGDGTWSVEFFATGSGGSSATTAVTLVVDNELFAADTVPPTIVGATDVSVPATGPAGAIVTYAITANDPGHGPVPVTCDPVSGTAFRPGSTLVTCTAFDAVGNQTVATFRVTVNVPPPSLTLTGASVTAVAPQTPATVTATVGSLIASDHLPVTCRLPSGTPTLLSPATFSDSFPGGITSVTCSVTDGFGHVVSAVTSVAVSVPAPSLILPAFVNVPATSRAGAVATYTASGWSVVDGALPAVCTPATGVTFPIGATTVQCTTTDTGGRASSGRFDVTVTIPPPTLSLPAPIAVTTFRDQGAYVSYAASAASAVYGALTPKCSTPSGALFVVGVTTVSCAVVDPGGLTAAGTFTVTVTRVPCGDAVVALERAASGGLRVEGGSTLAVVCGGVTVDSSARDAIVVDGGASLSATWVAVTGGVRARPGSIDPAAVVGSPALADPFSGLLLPGPAAVAQPAVKVTVGARTLQPGTYRGIEITGTAKVTFAPGVYIMSGGGLRIGGGASVQGDGVVFVNLRDRGKCEELRIEGSSAVELRGPAGGTLAGLLLLQDRGCDAGVYIEGGPRTVLRGAIYAPAAEVRIDGHERLTLNAPIITDSVRVSGGAQVTLNTLLP